VSIIAVVCGRKSTDQLGLTDERKSVTRQALDSPTDKPLVSVMAFADEPERETARQRKCDALAGKACASHVAAWCVGYPNREIIGGDGRRPYAPSLASTSSPNRGR
jgi:hypothetical protein